jgi:hypothetical protein
MIENHVRSGIQLVTVALHEQREQRRRLVQRSQQIVPRARGESD